MYKPLWLRCRYKACTECALHAAGLHLTPGTLKAVVASAPPTTECFHCRQRGTNADAVLLKKLGPLIRHRRGPSNRCMTYLPPQTGVNEKIEAPARTRAGRACQIDRDRGLRTAISGRCSLCVRAVIETREYKTAWRCLPRPSEVSVVLTAMHGADM